MSPDGGLDPPGGSCPLSKSVTMATPLNSHNETHNYLTVQVTLQFLAKLEMLARRKFRRPCNVTSTIIDHHRRRAKQRSGHGPDKAYGLISNFYVNTMPGHPFLRGHSVESVDRLRQHHAFHALSRDCGYFCMVSRSLNIWSF